MAKRKFQIGDKVRVKPDLKVGDTKFGYVFAKDQAQLKGRTLTIDYWDEWSGTYLFKGTDIDIPPYFLEKVDSAPAQLAPKFKIGDQVKFKQDLVAGTMYGGRYYDSNMNSTKDYVWKIISITEEKCQILCYSGPGKSMYWNVSPEMIEPYVEEQSKCCEDKTVNCTEPTPMKKELELPKEAFEENVLPKEPSSLIARRKNRKIYYTADKPIC